MDPVVLAERDWLDRRSRHEQAVDGLLAGHRERAGRGQAHPVEDFLFTYYSFRPARLRAWHPGAGVALAGPAARERLAWREHRETAGGAVTLDLESFLERRGGAVRHVVALLEATAGRAPQLGCFGLHEWAMVYRQPTHEVRHGQAPLRLGAAGTDAVVEANRIRCTHHDAFRFFTDPARPLNQLQPTRTDQVDLEQPGCLHATMDLYKWAYKLSPAISSDLVLAGFELARRAREFDMRASPYDLSALGYEPVRIETAAGKTEYVAAQRELAELGQGLRAQLLTACRGLLDADPPFAYGYVDDDATSTFTCEGRCDYRITFGQSDTLEQSDGLASPAAEWSNRSAKPMEEAGVSVPESTGRAVRTFADQQDIVGYGYDGNRQSFVLRAPRGADSASTIARLAAAVPAPIAVLDSQFTRTELAQLLEVVRERDWSPDAKDYTYGFWYDAVEDTLHIGGNFTTPSIQPLVDRYGSLLTLKQGPAGRGSGRRHR